MRGIFFAAIAFAVGFVFAIGAQSEPYHGEIVQCQGEYVLAQCRTFVVDSTTTNFWDFYGANARDYNPGADPGKRLDEWGKFERLMDLLNPGVDWQNLQIGQVIYLPPPVGTSAELMRRDKLEDDLDREITRVSEENYNLRDARDALQAQLAQLQQAFWLVFAVFFAILLVLYLHNLVQRLRASRREPADATEPIEPTFTPAPEKPRGKIVWLFARN